MNNLVIGKSVYTFLLKGIDMKRISSVISLSFLIILLFLTPVIGSDNWVEYNRDTKNHSMVFKKWRPYRTIATLYLWGAADFINLDEW